MLQRAEPLVKLLFALLIGLKLKGAWFRAWPGERQAEEALVRLCSYLPPDSALWRRFGETEFLAGVAVALAGHRGFDRGAYLALAESLAPGATTLERFASWHRAHRPGLPRFFSMLDRERRIHARSVA